MAFSACSFSPPRPQPECASARMIGAAVIVRRDIGRSFARPPAGITREARRTLLEYSWPGNVRELRNVLERAAIVCEGGLIASEHLAITPDELALGDLSDKALERAGMPGTFAVDSTNVKRIERQLIEQVLRECQGNKSAAARRLGLTRKGLYNKRLRFGML